MRIVTLLHLASVLPVALCIAACGLDSDGGSDQADAGGLVPPFDASFAPDASEAGRSETGGGEAAIEAGGDDATIGPGDDATIDPVDAVTPVDVHVPVDAIADAPKDAPHDSCVPTAEVCNDGVDNDCNGAVDCADTACNPTFACVPQPPGGWTLVELADATRPACDANFGNPTNVVEGPTVPPAVCSCGCTLDATNKGSCVQGTVHLMYSGSTLTCTSAPLNLNSNNGACNAFGFNFMSVVGARSQITPLPYTAGACTAAVNKALPPVTFAAQGRTCAPSTTMGAGCTNSNVCAPKPSGDFASCVQKNGDANCPPGFPNKHVVGSGVTDTRDCTACTCSVSGSCANATFTDYDDPQCSPTGKSLPTPADNACNANSETAPTTYVSWRYSADVANVACAASTNAPTNGTATLTGTKTVCCP